MSRTGDLAELQPVSFASLNTPNLGRQGRAGMGWAMLATSISERCAFGVPLPLRNGESPWLLPPACALNSGPMGFTFMSTVEREGL